MRRKGGGRKRRKEKLGKEETVSRRDAGDAENGKEERRNLGKKKR
jgi:hypothetical protein